MKIYEIIMQNPIWQLFWFLAMIVAFIWLLQKDDKNTVKIIIVSSCLWIVHFFFMWVYSAMAMSCISIIRLFLSLKYKRNKRVFWWVLMAVFVMWVMTFENKLSLLPIVWSCITAYWYFFCEWFRLRLFIFISSLFRTTFHLNIWSVWWVMNEIVSQLILIFIMYKLIRESWKKLAVIEKLSTVFKWRMPDVERYITIFDYINHIKNSSKNKFKRLLNSLLTSIKKLKSSLSFSLRFSKKKLCEAEQVIKNI